MGWFDKVKRVGIGVSTGGLSEVANYGIKKASGKDVLKNGIGSVSKKDIFGDPGGADKMNMLTADQQQLLKDRAALASGADATSLAGLTGVGNALQNYGVQSSYQALPDFEGTYKAQYADPMARQFQNTMSNLQHSGERNSSGARMRDMSAAANYTQNLAQAREGMMMNERQKQQQAMEQAYGRQLQALQGSAGVYGQMQNIGNSVLGTNSNQMYQQQGSPGLIGYGTQLATLGSSIKGLFS